MRATDRAGITTPLLAALIGLCLLAAALVTSSWRLPLGLVALVGPGWTVLRMSSRRTRIWGVEDVGLSVLLSFAIDGFAALVADLTGLGIRQREVGVLLAAFEGLAAVVLLVRQVRSEEPVRPARVRAVQILRVFAAAAGLGAIAAVVIAIQSTGSAPVEPSVSLAFDGGLARGAPLRVSASPVALTVLVRSNAVRGRVMLTSSVYGVPVVQESVQLHPGVTERVRIGLRLKRSGGACSERFMVTMAGGPGAPQFLEGVAELVGSSCRPVGIPGGGAVQPPGIKRFTE